MLCTFAPDGGPFRSFLWLRLMAFTTVLPMSLRVWIAKVSSTSELIFPLRRSVNFKALKTNKDRKLPYIESYFSVYKLLTTNIYFASRVSDTRNILLLSINHRQPFGYPGLGYYQEKFETYDTYPNCGCMKLCK